MKHKIGKIIETIFIYLAVWMMILGAALLVGLLIFAPAIQTKMYYLLLTCGVGGVAVGLLIYIFIFGELERLMQEHE